MGAATAGRVAVVAVAVCAGCGGAPARGLGSAGAPTLAAIASATIEGIVDVPVALVDGRWEGEPYVEGGASRPTAGIAEDFIRSGDLDADGREESAVIAWSATGGSGTRSFIAVFGAGRTGPVNLGTAALGDRVQVIDAAVVDGLVVVDVVQHDADDPACCPTQVATRRFALQRGGLLERDASVRGTLSLDTAGGVDWHLVRLGNQAVDAGVTLRFEGGRMAGQGPCNRYFAGAAPGDGPGGLALGEIGATKMYCGEGPMRLEHGYFAALAASRRFGFVAGRLAITYDAEGGPATLLFAR